MNKYHLRISAKTHFINIFRSVFKIKLFERLLISDKEPSLFMQILIPPNYLYKKGTWREVTRNNIRYKLDLHSSVDHYIYFGYKDTSYDTVLNEIRNANVILDIGAHIASSALYFAIANPKARIIAFEPHPDTYAKAKVNVSLNQFKNIELFNVGLGEKKEKVKLYEVNESNPGMNRIAVEGEHPFKSINIESLDQFCLERKIDRIDVVKLDVEGFECSVLKGGQDILRKHKPTMIVEVDDIYLKENGGSAKQLVDLLGSLGYTDFFRTDKDLQITDQTDLANCHFDMIAK